MKTIIREAAEQSGRGIVPELTEPLSFEKALNETIPEETFFFDLTGDLLTKDEHPRPLPSLSTRRRFAPEEVALAKGKGCLIANLGPLTLRGETAAIVASYRIIHSI
jgi:16S rRNA (uracil1498-N3)-methyltransferase